MNPNFVFWAVLVISVLSIGATISIGYFRIKGDISICRNYYKEMSLAECYFSSKTVRIPSGK